MNSEKNKINTSWVSLSETRFWLMKQKIEEKIIEASRGEDKWAYTRIVKDSNVMKELIYSHLGICGASYVVADKEEDKIHYFHSKELQPYLMQKFSNLPFVEIPYDWRYQSKGVKTIAKDYDEYHYLVDAMFIQVRNEQNLISRDRPSPDFYRHLPRTKSPSRRYLLPFEGKLAETFKMIYCTSGEILFFMYAWRLLVRIIQEKGFTEELEMDLSYETFANGGNRYNFWEEVAKAKNYIGNSWYEGLLNQSKTNAEYIEKGIEGTWNKLLKEVDHYPIENMSEEYKRLGLVKGNERQSATAELVSLLDYALHIAENFLGWKYKKNEHIEYETHHWQKRTLTKQGILSYLHKLYEELDLRSQVLEEDRTFNNNSKTEQLSFETIINDYQLDYCLQKIVKSFLLQIVRKLDVTRASIKDILYKLHLESRFPILPYYYTLAAGNSHFPKEHVVYCLWNSKNHEVNIKLSDEEEAIKESGVVFIHFTLSPIWQLNPRFNFMRNRKTKRRYSYLSEENYNRLFRMFSIFNSLAKPIVEKLYYGKIFSHSLGNKSTLSFMESFSHEVKKGVTNIFDLSNLTLEEMFGDQADEVLEFITAKMPADSKLAPRLWKIIPYPKKMEIWRTQLLIWAGFHGENIIKLKNFDLKSIIEKCNELAVELHSGRSILADVIGNDQYKKSFEARIKKVQESGATLIFTSPELEILTFSKKKNLAVNVIFLQNAFIRSFLAALVNVYQHTIGKFTIEVSKKNDFNLSVVIYNPFDTEIKPKTHVGTEKVLEICLNNLKGELNVFKELNEKDWKGHSMNAQNYFTQFNKGTRFWITQFSIPLDQMFSKD